VSENTEAISVLGAHAQGEACGKHRCIVPGVSKHQEDRGLGDYALGEGFPKDGTSPQLRVSAPSDLVLHLPSDAHARRKRLPPLPCEVMETK